MSTTLEQIPILAAEAALVNPASSGGIAVPQDAGWRPPTSTILVSSYKE